MRTKSPSLVPFFISASLCSLGHTGWTDTSPTGACSVTGADSECVQSPGYPSLSYDTETCYFEWSSYPLSGYVDVTLFNVPSGNDFLTVDGVSYTGAGRGLDGSHVYGHIGWYPSGSSFGYSWKICLTGWEDPTVVTTTTDFMRRRRSSLSQSADDDESDNTWIYLLVAGFVIIIICIPVIVLFQRYAAANQQKFGYGYYGSQPHQMNGPAPTTVPMSAWGQPQPSPVQGPAPTWSGGTLPTGSNFSDPNIGDASPQEPVTISVQCGQCRALVKIAMAAGEHLQYNCPSCGALNQFSVTTPKESASEVVPEAPVPSYWTSDRESKGGFVTESDATRRALQTILDQTWKNQITRDRPKGSKVQKFEVVMVHRNENFEIWDSYARTRSHIEEDCDGCEEYNAKTQSEGIIEDPDASDFLSRAELKKHCNEFYLFHGTKPSAAKAICDTDFLLKMSGSNAGTLYGPGLYFAEASSKSDEYAEEDKEGIFSGLYAMLVCRVVCGNINYTDEVRPKVQGLVDSILTDKTHHAVLGDREKCRGTYREFIVFDKDQVYPEYAIIYRRVSVDGKETE